MVQEIDYDNLTVEDVVRFVETINWKLVPFEILLKKRVLEFVDDFPEIESEIINKFYRNSGYSDSELLAVIKYCFEDYYQFEPIKEKMFCLACENGHISVVSFLLSKEISTEFWEGYSIRSAAQNGHLEIIKLLLKNGARNSVGFDWSLGLAAQNGHMEIIKLLLEHGADVNFNDGWAIKRASLYYYHIEVVKFLEEHREKSKIISKFEYYEC